MKELISLCKLFLDLFFFFKNKKSVVFNCLVRFIRMHILYFNFVIVSFFKICFIFAVFLVDKITRFIGNNSSNNGLKFCF